MTIALSLLPLPKALPADPCAGAQQLWVSQPLLEELSVDGIEKAVNDFALEVTGRKKPDTEAPHLRETLAKVDQRTPAQWPKMLLAAEDTPDVSGFMIPSEFRVSRMEIPTLRFGRPQVEAATDASGKPISNRYRVRVPVDELDVTMNVGLDAKVSGTTSQALFGIQGLRASLDRSKAPGVPPPAIEYEVELKPGQSLAEAIAIQAGSGKFHLPASQIDIGLAIRPEDERRREAYEQAIGSPELQALASRIAEVRKPEELERLLSSDELRGLDQRHPGIGDHFAAYLKQECSGLYWEKQEQVELSQAMLVREIQMKLALDALKPQVANRSSLEALTLMRLLMAFAGRVETEARQKLAAGEKAALPSIGKAGETPLYDGIPGVYPVLNEKLGPLLAEKLAEALKNSSLSEPLEQVIPGMTPSELLGGTPRDKARPFQPADRKYETRKWSPAHPSVGGVVTSMTRCEDQRQPSPNTTSWLSPDLAARLAKSQSVAVGITVDEVNSYLAEAFSEESQNAVEYRNKEENDELERKRKAARKAGRPEPKGEMKSPDQNLRLTFTRPPRLLIEKDPKTGKNALYLDVDLRERRAGVGGFLTGGTKLRSRVRVYQDREGMVRLDATRTGQRVDDRHVVSVLDTVLQAVTLRMFAKSVVLHSKVIPDLNKSIKLDPQIGEWRINALEPSSDGSRVVLGLAQASPMR